MNLDLDDSAARSRPDRPAPPLLTQAAIVRKANAFEVSVDGIRVGVEQSRAAAVTALCKEAIRRKETLVTTVLEGAGRSYLTMTPDGQVSKSAAPAHGSVKPIPGVVAASDPLAAGSEDDSMRSWVEDSLLVDDRPSAPPKRRFGFGRR